MDVRHTDGRRYNQEYKFEHTSSKFQLYILTGFGFPLLVRFTQS
jgi:hypothetical protein